MDPLEIMLSLWSVSSGMIYMALYVVHVYMCFPRWKGPRIFAVTTLIHAWPWFPVVDTPFLTIDCDKMTTCRCKDQWITRVVPRLFQWHLVKYLTACKQLARSLTGSLITDLWTFIPSIIRQSQSTRADYRLPTMELMISVSSLSGSVRIHVHVGESMDATALANCQTLDRTNLNRHRWLDACRYSTKTSSR